MTGAIATAVGKYLVPKVFGGAADIGTQLIAGKTGENVGAYNEAQSAKLRAQQDAMNENPNMQGDRQELNSNRAASAQQGRSRADLILGNQLDASNKRSDLQNNMTANEQIINANRGTQLADNYVQSARDQANASQGIFNSIMNRQATMYGNVGLK